MAILVVFSSSFCSVFYIKAGRGGGGESYRHLDSSSFTLSSISISGDGIPLFGLYRDMPLDIVWFSGLAVLIRVYNSPFLNSWYRSGTSLQLRLMWESF